MRINAQKQSRWIEELIELCSNSSSLLKDGSRLTLLSAGKDLNGWLHDQRAYKRKDHEAGWDSSKADFNAAFEALGPQAKSFIDPYMRALNSPLGHLPRALETSLVTTHRPAAISNYAGLLVALNSASFLSAAWEDLIEGCKDDTLETNLLHLRRDNLWDTAKSFGHDTGSLGIGNKLAGVLEDNAFHIAVASADLGDRTYPDYGEIDPKKFAGLPIEDRLDICKRLLLVQPPQANNIVWLCIQNASLSGIKLESGSGAVTFYDMAWLKENLFKDGPFKKDLPAELLGQVYISEHDFPDKEKIVLARVDLGKSVVSSAPTRAKVLAEAMLTLANAEKERWKLLEGYIVFRDGKRGASSTFQVPLSPEKLIPAYDHTPHMLKQLEAELRMVAASIDTHLLRDALSARKWLIDVEHAEPLSKLVMSVRVQELVNTWATKSTKTWKGFARDLLQDQWCKDFLKGQLYHACSQVLHTRSGLEKTVIEELDGMRKDIIEDGEGLSFQFHLDKALLHLPRIIDIFKDTPSARILKEVYNYYSSGITASTKWDMLRLDFQRMLKRLSRYRNAAQHGGPMVGEVVSTIDSFGYRLAMTSVNNTLHALLAGKNPLTAQTDIQIKAEQTHTDLSSGSASTRIFM